MAQTNRRDLRAHRGSLSQFYARPKAADSCCMGWSHALAFFTLVGTIKGNNLTVANLG